MEATRAAVGSAGVQLPEGLWPGLRLLLAALALSLLVRSLLIQPFQIPSRSMSPTLESGDFVLVDKRAYGWSLAALPLAAPLTRPLGLPGPRLAARTVRRGDVVAFVGPDGRDYVKRVVGRGGDWLELRSGMLFLNGMAIPCAPARDGLCLETLPGGQPHLIRSNGSGPTATFGPVLVPEGHYFVLGDNRDISADSRIGTADGGVGLVPDPQVIGRAAHIFLSLDRGLPPHRAVRWPRLGRSID